MLKVDRPAKCVMGTDHGKDVFADSCDIGSMRYACKLRLEKIVDSHPSAGVRKRALYMLADKAQEGAESHPNPRTRSKAKNILANREASNADR